VRRCATLRDGPIRILEIGSWAGASAVTWARALQALGRTGGVTCIDTWRPYLEAGTGVGAHYRDMTEAAESGDVYRLFLHNLKACGVDSMVTHRTVDSRDLPTIFAPGSFDIVYIDGGHSLPYVRSDISAATDLVGAGGIICGDDLELQHHEVDATDHATAVASGVDYTCAQRAQQNYHPGVTEGVAEAFGLVANHEGFWAVERDGANWVPAALDCSKAELPPHIRDALDERAMLLGEIGHFNIVRSANRFVAVSRALGPVDIFEERLGDRDLEPIVLVGNSLDEVCSKAASAVPFGAAESYLDRRLGELAALIDAESGAASAARAEQDRSLAELATRLDAELTRLRTELLSADATKAEQDRRLSEVTARIDKEVAQLQIQASVAEAGTVEQDRRLGELTAQIDTEVAQLQIQASVAEAGTVEQDRRLGELTAQIDKEFGEHDRRLADLAERIAAWQTAGRAELAQARAEFAARTELSAAQIDSTIAAVHRSSAELAELRQPLVTLTWEAIDADRRLRELERTARPALLPRLLVHARQD
jgi:predicted O-methyltransferase YrrM